MRKLKSADIEFKIWNRAGNKVRNRTSSYVFKKAGQQIAAKIWNQSEAQFKNSILHRIVGSFNEKA